MDETGKQKEKHCGKPLPYNEIERIGTHAYQTKRYASNFEIDAVIASYFLVNLTAIKGTLSNQVLDS